MRRVIITCVLLVGCLPPAMVDDPHAVAPDYSRWEARVAAAPSRVFAAALVAIADSGYLARNADPAVGVIATNLRSVSFKGSTGEYRLDFMILPGTGDSTRILIRGESCFILDGAQQCYALNGYRDDWFLVRGIGAAVLQQLSVR